jgi:hypothetical protein
LYEGYDYQVDVARTVLCGEVGVCVSFDDGFNLKLRVGSLEIGPLL